MATAVTTDTVEEKLTAAIKEMGAEGEVTRDATFDALDVDSLDLVELAQVVEDEFGVELTGEDVKDLKTIGEAIDLVVAKSS
jgi:acyl carrier protein